MGLDAEQFLWVYLILSGSYMLMTNLFHLFDPSLSTYLLLVSLGLGIMEGVSILGGKSEDTNN